MDRVGLDRHTRQLALITTPTFGRVVNEFVPAFFSRAPSGSPAKVQRYGHRGFGLPSPCWRATIGVVGASMPHVPQLQGVLASALAGGMIEALLPRLQASDLPIVHVLDSLGLPLQASIYRKLCENLDSGILSSDDATIEAG